MFVDILLYASSSLLYVYVIYLFSLVPNERDTNTIWILQMETEAYESDVPRTHDQ